MVRCLNGLKWEDGMAKLVVLKRFDAYPTAKIAGAFYFCAGIVLGVILGLATLFSDDFKVGTLVFAVLAPFLYGGAGFVAILLMAWLYNLLAFHFGGITFELEDAAEQAPLVEEASEAPPQKAAAKPRKRKVPRS